MARLCIVLALLFTACSSSPPCNASTCASGCCDSSGVCRAAAPSTCGNLGSACTNCLATQQCQLGVCVTPGGASGGGSGGGNGGGSGGGSGGGGGGSSTFDAGTTLDAAYETLWREACGFSSRCGLYADPDACARRQRVPQLSPTLKVNLNAARLAACISSLRTASCAEAIGDELEVTTMLYTTACAPLLGDVSDPDGQRLPFQGLLDGQVPTGGACRHSVECLPAGWCDLSTACPGTCRSRVDAGIVEEDGRCAPGFYTSISYPSGLLECRKVAGLGESCTRDCGGGVSCGVKCANGLRCGQDLRCQVWPALNPGALCERPSDCVDPLVCLAGVCSPRGGTGELCSADTCKLDRSCGNSNLCTANRALGEACTASAGCDVGLTCTAHDGGTTCTPAAPPMTGDHCFINEHCPASDYCSSSEVCARRKQAGMVCTGFDCAQGLDCVSGRCAGCLASW